MAVKVRVWCLISRSFVAPVIMLRRRHAGRLPILSSSRENAIRLIALRMMIKPVLLHAVVLLITLSRSVLRIYRRCHKNNNNNNLFLKINIYHIYLHQLYFNVNGFENFSLLYKFAKIVLVFENILSGIVSLFFNYF